MISAADPGGEEAVDRARSTRRLDAARGTTRRRGCRASAEPEPGDAVQDRHHRGDLRAVDAVRCGESGRLPRLTSASSALPNAVFGSAASALPPRIARHRGLRPGQPRPPHDRIDTAFNGNASVKGYVITPLNPVIATPFIGGSQHPVVEIEQDIRQVLAVRVAQREGRRAGLVRRPCAGAARRRPARAVSALSSTSDQAPTVSPAKQGLAWAPALIAATICALASPLKRQRPRQADHMPAIDQPPPVLAARWRRNAPSAVFCQRRVAIMCSASSIVTRSHVVDPLADRIVAPAERLAGQREVVAREVEPRRHRQTPPPPPPGRARAPPARAPAPRASRLRTITQRQ